ncbi:hypothetical protein [Aminobacter sp. MET-1]|uniref:hypothetical protein n=1 Tax=Aminobacter sp. MET-1 TaxID=2951085 RepID=UPI002269D41F|nr:hypothetical protein [Aminobacter sp. MET-1]MCX8571153.1 hypothetical protein [Aminobacter sp. MET-1]MCX8573349.1 hypothetical protein [Aminobacter sp. MET-1]
MAEIPASGRPGQLRKKFQEKGRAAVAELKSPRGQFASALHSFTESAYAASSWDKDFEDELFRRFELEAPADFMTWVASATEGLFRSVDKPPIWVGEVDWCFHNGTPLAFLAQFSDDDDATFYVFRGYNEEKRTFFKMRAWRGEARIILDGKIGG